MRNFQIPKGFKFASATCGLKRTNNPDMGLIVSERKCNAFGMFTQNTFKGAPVIITQKHLKNRTAQAIIVNAGNANVATGEKGLNNAKEMASMTAKFLNIKIDDVLVASTGVIGMQLDMNKITKGIKECTASLKQNAFKDVAKAIMTTDSYMKVASESFKVANKEVTISGMVKGAGMIHPNMATMLCFILTDANIHYSALKEAMMSSVKKTFNCMTVDGDTSTSDMAIILANGMAENKIIEKKGNAFAEFSKHLYTVCEKLAKMIAADGEGATKLIEINILNCRTEQEGEKIAKKIATSTLFKTAMFGNDPNWGRIICAIGNSGVNIDPDKIIVDINDITVFRNGIPADYDEKKLKKSLAKKEIFVTVNLNQGKEKCRVWTCDLTYDYVKINASYRT